MSRAINKSISIGKNLGDLRRKNKLTQEQVAAQLQLKGFNTTRAILSQIEIGIHNIDISILLALKEIYKVNSFDDFFKDLFL